MPVDTDQLQADVEAHGEHISELISRSTEQAVDIKNLKEELEELEEAISSEDEITA